MFFCSCHNWVKELQDKDFCEYNKRFKVVNFKKKKDFMLDASLSSKYAFSNSSIDINIVNIVINRYLHISDIFIVNKNDTKVGLFLSI